MACGHCGTVFNFDPSAMRSFARRRSMTRELTGDKKANKINNKNNISQNHFR
jgi:hypothetical protein